MGSVVRKLPVNVGDVCLIPGSGRCLGEGNGNHSNIFTWKIPWTEELAGHSPWGHKTIGHNLVAKQKNK